MTDIHNDTYKGKTSPFSFMKTDDKGYIRYGIWHCTGDKKNGTIILLNGRSEFMEKYSETISELLNKGFNVYSMDWRGQGLSERLLSDRQKGFIPNYEIYLNDVKKFIDEIVKPKAVLPVTILAHSMGGHIALRLIHDHPTVAEKVVLSSPMIEIFNFSVIRRITGFVAEFAVKAGMGHAYIPCAHRYNPDKEKFEGNRLTSDPKRFMATRKEIMNNRKLTSGGVTYRWLWASFQSIDIVNHPGYAENIKTPVLMISAGSDRVVSIKAQKRFSARLSDCRFIEIKDARHEVLMETDAIRSIFWDELTVL